MEINRLARNTKRELIANLVIGMAILVVGILMALLDVGPIKNDRVIVALSLIPFAYAISLWWKLRGISRHPSGYIEDRDERLIASRDKADALSLRGIRYVLYLGFLGYSFAKSEDVLDSALWWVLAAVLLSTITLPSIVLGQSDRKPGRETTE